MISALQTALAQAGFHESLEVSHPHLFSPHTVTITARDLARMQAVIAAVESVVATPGYQALVLARSPASARHDTAARGACFGYDFHLTASGPQLIEINTNAGGALLALAQRRAVLPGIRDTDAIEQSLIAMFREEWRAARGDFPLRRIAIVDDAPASQYLYPEFVLFQALFRSHGTDAAIAAPEALTLRGNRLLHADGSIDLVYNRLTDFALAEPAHATLHTVWRDDLAVITPHPRAHALYADKRNLVTLTDSGQLQALGIAQDVIDTLRAGIPRTRVVTRSDAEMLWSERKQLFFKPAAGYGSKAIYRGDKITKRVWEEILGADYVAQALAPPGELAVADGALKYDVRVFAYRSRVQLLAARLYQGQTTNFRTPGGGFAPVIVKETA